jgi:hypothetical protein
MVISLEHYRNLERHITRLTQWSDLQMPETIKFLAYARERGYQVECSRCRIGVDPNRPNIFGGYVFCRQCMNRISHAHTYAARNGGPQ